MGKIENAFRMLLIIQHNPSITGVELAKILDITERQVQKYVHDLRKVGIDIKSKRGKVGGYYIENCPFCKKNIINYKDQKITVESNRI